MGWRGFPNNLVLNVLSAAATIFDQKPTFKTTFFLILAKTPFSVPKPLHRISRVRMCRKISGATTTPKNFSILDTLFVFLICTTAILVFCYSIFGALFSKLDYTLFELWSRAPGAHIFSYLFFICPLNMDYKSSNDCIVLANAKCGNRNGWS